MCEFKCVLFHFINLLSVHNLIKVGTANKSFFFLFLVCVSVLMYVCVCVLCMDLNAAASPKKKRTE